MPDADDPSPPPPSPPPLPTGPRVLVTGPMGGGKSRLVTAAFDAAIDAHGDRAALLLLPTYGQVEHAKRLALSRRDERRDPRGILDAPYATFTSLGERVLPDFRVRGLPSRMERELLAAEALRRVAVPAFEAVRARGGFRARFLRLVKEMKQTGLDGAELRRRARAAADGLGVAARERLLGFLDVFEAYDALLAEAGLVDHEDVLRGLVADFRARGSAALSGLRCLVVDGFEDLSGVETSLLLAAADAVTAGGGRVLVTLPHDPVRADLAPATARVRERLLKAAFVEHAVPGFRRSRAPALVRLAEALFAGTPAAASGGLVDPSTRLVPGPELTSLVGADPADEADRIAREILRLRRAGALDRGFRDVGIVLRRLDGVGPSLRRCLEAYGIPARLVGAGVPLPSEAVSRALRGPLAFIAGDDGVGDRPFDASAMLDALRWRALASGDPVPVAAVDALDARWRLHGFPADVDAFRAATARTPLGDAVGELEGLAAERPGARGPGGAFGLLERAIERLLPLPAPSPLDTDGRPTDRAHDERLRRAVAGKARWLDLVREARAAAQRTRLSPSLDVRGALDELLRVAAEATSEPPDRRLDAVAILDAEEARHWELPIVFVAGLVERQFPLHAREDVFLRDDDRDALRSRLAGNDPDAPVWRTARESECHERRLFLAAVTRARTRLVLSRPAADDAGRECHPSPVWRAVNGALGLAEDDPDRLGRAPADLGRLSVTPGEAVVEGDLVRFVGAKLGALPPREAPGRAEVRLAVALSVAAGAPMAGLLARAARFRRAVEDPLPAAATAAFRASVTRVSPTLLTMGRICLHRFFLARVARVPEDAGGARGPGFDRRLYGTLVHAALHRALAEDDVPEGEIAADVLQPHVESLDGPGLLDWLREDLARIVRLARAREATTRLAGYVPSVRDLEFDLVADDGEPVRLGFEDGAFALTGRIDRLDTRRDLGARQAIVVDYKTGVATSEESAKAMRDLEDLQLPLYARAVERVRGVSVVGLEHVVATRRARQGLYADDRREALLARGEGKGQVFLSKSDFRGVIEGAERRAVEVVAAVRRGADGGHRKRPLDRSRCDRCAFARVCRPDRARFAPVPDEEEDDA